MSGRLLAALALPLALVAAACSNSTGRRSAPTTGTPAARFATLPPGSALPSGEEYARRVPRAGWEPRAEDHTANHTIALPGEDYRRACFEGYLDWLRAEAPAYQAGDEWGCVGHWYSGRWKDQQALRYVRSVQQHFQGHPWQRKGF